MHESRPNWLFDIDALTKSINYKPVVVGNQSNGNACTKACDDAGEKKDAEDLENKDSEVPSTEEPRVNQEKDANINNTNNIDTTYECADDPNMPNLEEIVYSNDDEDNDAEADMNNLNTFMPVSPIPTTRLHKDHPLEQIIRDIHSAPQTRRMTKSVTEHEPKKVIQALKDPSWIEAMQEELLQFKLQQVWTLVDLPYGKRAIGTKWVYRNKKDERGIVIRNKARLVAQGYTQEEGINYGKTLQEQQPKALVSNNKGNEANAVKASSCWVWRPKQKVLDHGNPQQDLKDKGVIDSGCSRHMTGNKSYLTDYEEIDGGFVSFRGNSKGGKIIGKDFKLTDESHHPKDSPFDLEAYTDSDYAGISLVKKSTTGGCQFLRSRLISWQCKKQTVVANSTTKEEYVAASNCYGQIIHKGWLKWNATSAEDGIKVKIAVFNDEYDTPSHTKKVFANMRRQGKDFSRTVTPLFATMLIQSQAVEGKGSRQPIEPQHIPTTTSPSHVESIPTIASSSHPKKTHKHRKTKRKATEISQSSRPTTLVADETVHEERVDSIERAVTTAISLDAEQGSGNIISTQSMVTVIALENIKTAQDLEINNLKKRVKKLEKKKKSRTPQLKRRLFKVRIESSAEKSLETQGRYGHDTKINTASTSITTASINITTIEPIITVSAPIATAGVPISTVEPSTPPTTTTTFIEDEDLTIAQTVMKMRTSETATRPIVPPQQQLYPKDKGKGIMQEPEKPVKAKGKDQIEYDANMAKRLQAELDEEVRLEREKEASNAALIEELDTIKARIYADAQLAKRLQAEERE
ncbi:putative ribonuclease H-like domain-containing protein [Tanacetum coccineum]